ncbi:uncharacterized protein LOC129597049 [Paramacrobiotus metropolitanus]|uniref:uncharacterized protein LOC129597049 n=1 Tax=Paramacrobiotus metropolitanus TaxID=2943436 RepID=UPI002445F9FF|nr:uncharacterized protein LOC129597049 [Paramacrobiotus metropolitanus]
MGFASLAFLISALLSYVSAQQACGSNGVACIGLPNNCISGADTSKCDLFAKVYISPASSYSVRIELTAVPNGPQKLGNPSSIVSRWIAVGFSPNGTMPNAAAVHCFELNGQASAKLTWNIPDGKVNIGYATIDQSPLSVVKTSLDGYGLQCTVDLKKQFTIAGVNVDLSQKYFLIDATGPVQSNGTMSVHDKPPGSSAPNNFSF